MKSIVQSSNLHFLSLTGIALFAVFALLGIAGAEANRTAKVADLSGLASVSGKVGASKSFEAAKVYFRNMDGRMLYMVYTNGNKFQAMYLAPGNYEITVQAEGLESAVQKLVLKDGEKATADVTLHESTAQGEAGMELMPYDQLYPQGLGGRLPSGFASGATGQISFQPSNGQRASGMLRSTLCPAMAIPTAHKSKLVT